MVWHHDSLQCVSVFLNLSVMVVQAEDRSGVCLGLSGQVCLGFKDVDRCDLVDFGSGGPCSR